MIGNIRLYASATRTAMCGAVLILGSHVSSGIVVAQTLLITAPSNNAVTEPGKKVVVQVSSDKMGPVVIVSTVPGVEMQDKDDPPYVFTISIPQSTKPGRYTITAFANSGTANPIVSRPIDIVVNSPGLRCVEVKPREAVLPYVGARVAFQAIAETPDGMKLVLMGENPQLAVTSQNPSVVRVDDGGVLTAIDVGKTTVDVTCGTASKKIAVTVIAGTAGDLNGDGSVDQEDVNLLLGFLNTQALVANDARDLNHDGRIDALDARLLTTLCTRPRCATY